MGLKLLVAEDEAIIRLDLVELLKESGFDMDQVIVLDTVKEAFKYIESHASKDDIILLENDLPDAFNH